ncbi:MAG TPA: hypothetical protein VIL36_01770 [Acidimicrobiales bacterium]
MDGGGVGPGEAPEPEIDFGQRPRGWAVLAGAAAAVVVIAGVVVFAGRMAGDTADPIDGGNGGAGAASTPSTTDPMAGEGPVVEIVMDATDPNVLVTSEPAGIDCGVEPSVGERVHPHCEARFPPGTEVSLTVQIPPVVLELQAQAGWVGCGDLDQGSFSQPPPCVFPVLTDHTVCLYTGFNDCPDLPPPPGV